MKTGASLALIGLGAILAFAVTGNASFFNIHTAGWILMLIGVVGLLIPQRNAGWLGRRLLVRRSYPSGRVEHIPVPPYVARNPGTAALERGLPSRPTLLDQDDDLIDRAGSGYEDIQEAEGPDYRPQGAGYRPQYRPGTGRLAPDGPSAGSTEVIEDLYQEP